MILPREQAGSRNTGEVAGVIVLSDVPEACDGTAHVLESMNPIEWAASVPDTVVDVDLPWESLLFV